ncbi:uncharacterized protein LOC133199850 [Saccostrea echinata]|uniref:uncharacterized protein LOC133199850 n=1 Tax=Saccostrea echinata TaxID=191078 RepID=UPI002A828184|nr:uncharacterized protein LOC133199850 [Saccostrea echinata]
MSLLRKPTEEIVKLADFKIDRIEIDGDVITVGRQDSITDSEDCEMEVEKMDIRLVKKKSGDKNMRDPGDHDIECEEIEEMGDCLIQKERNEENLSGSTMDVWRYKMNNEDKEKKESGLMIKERFERKSKSLGEDVWRCKMENEDKEKKESGFKIKERLKRKSNCVICDSRRYKMEIGDKEKKEPSLMEKEKIDRELRISQSLSSSAVISSSFTVPRVHNVSHISCVTSDRLWISDYRLLLQVDAYGHKTREIEIDSFPLGGIHTVSEDGELLALSNNRVQKITSDGNITTFFQTECEKFYCIHSSRINGDILVGCENEVRRYDKMGKWIRNIVMYWRHRIYYLMYITENKNGDILVSDNERKSVVVVNKSGRHRFIYKGQQSESSFDPRGICTDIIGQILVCDFNLFNPSVHLLHQDGQFLRLVLTREHGLRQPTALCVDDKHNLYLGQEKSNTITVYKCLQETDVSVFLYLMPIPTIKSRFTVSKVDGLYHISKRTSERLWVSDIRHLLQVDSSGHEQQEEQVEFYSIGGVHSVTEDGDLLFIDHNNVRKMTEDGIITTLIKPEAEIRLCVHSSRINGDILLGCHDEVVRYDKSGKRTADFRMNMRHGGINYPKYITENKNGDIWISDYVEKTVVVFDKSGHYRLDYKGQLTRYGIGSTSTYPFYFEPRGICTDILGQILVCDTFDPSVHLLNQDGQFLRLLLTREHGLLLPTALCVDDKHNLYVGQENSNTITVYKYLQETENLDMPMVESG